MFSYHIQTVLLFFLIFPPSTPARTVPKLAPNPITVKNRNHISVISEIKKYFHRFNAQFQSAITRYRAKLGLPVSGNLYRETLSQNRDSRCGVSDAPPSLHSTRHYAYFTDQPRWTRNIPMTLSYAFLPENSITSLNSSEIRTTFERAFSHWSSVIPVNFTLTDEYVFADIKIGFYNGAHGDGEPFDGVLGVLAHSFSPEIGWLHLDAAETWAVDFESEKSGVAVDLESVAIHEIGHVLGLKHSSVREAVMYPSLKPRERKLDLKVDDIKGIQALYGSNPNFKSDHSNMESYISSNEAVDFRFRSPLWINLVLVFVGFSCM